MISYYMDHNVHAKITVGLRRRGIDCLIAYDDGRSLTPDDELLARATIMPAHQVAGPRPRVRQCSAARVTFR
jgi:hypothetical protein